MRTKFLLLQIIALLCCSFFAQGQKSYYFKIDGSSASRENADYVRNITAPDSGSLFYNFTEYYIKGKPKSMGKTSKLDPLVLEDTYVTYYSDSKIHTINHYQKGIAKGIATEKYPNGKLYRVRNYIQLSKEEKEADDFNYSIESCYDSVGKPLVVNGNGYYIGFNSTDDNEDFKKIFEEGEVKNGKRIGNWKGAEYSIDSLKFTETYLDGKLISGHSVTKNGQEYNYAKKSFEPVYPGGTERFYSFLSEKIRYPFSSAMQHITGRVKLSFVVEKDGTLTNIKVLRTPSTDLGDEAIRVLNLSPKWIPGMLHGRPVSTEYVIPISFNIIPGK